MAEPTVLSSSQSTPVAKESGANVHPCRTPDSIVNQALWDWDAEALKFVMHHCIVNISAVQTGKILNGTLECLWNVHCF